MTAVGSEGSYERLINPWVEYAIREIEATYGDTVSCYDKAKSLLKFGNNTDLGTSSETVQSQGGTETYVSDNLIDSISSDDNADTALLNIEGHTIDGSGNFTFTTQTVTLTGQTRAALSTPLARVTRVFNAGATEFAGDVYVYQNTALTAGVPNDATKIHAKVEAGDQQTQKCSTTISNVDYYAITSLGVDVNKKTAAQVDFRLKIRRQGGVFRTAVQRSASSTGGGVFTEFKPYLIVPKNSDVRVDAVASTTAVSVDAFINGFLFKVQ